MAASLPITLRTPLHPAAAAAACAFAAAKHTAPVVLLRTCAAALLPLGLALANEY